MIQRDRKRGRPSTRILKFESIEFVHSPTEFCQKQLAARELCNSELLKSSISWTIQYLFAYYRIFVLWKIDKESKLEPRNGFCFFDKKKHTSRLKHRCSTVSRVCLWWSCCYSIFYLVFFLDNAWIITWKIPENSIAINKFEQAKKKNKNRKPNKWVQTVSSEFLIAKMFFKNKIPLFYDEEIKMALSKRDRFSFRWNKRY